MNNKYSFFSSFECGLYSQFYFTHVVVLGPPKIRGIKCIKIFKIWVFLVMGDSPLFLVVFSHTERFFVFFEKFSKIFFLLLILYRKVPVKCETHRQQSLLPI